MLWARLVLEHTSAARFRAAWGVGRARRCRGPGARVAPVHARQGAPRVDQGRPPRWQAALLPHRVPGAVASLGMCVTVPRACMGSIAVTVLAPASSRTWCAAIQHGSALLRPTGVAVPADGTFVSVRRELGRSSGDTAVHDFVQLALLYLQHRTSRTALLSRSGVIRVGPPTIPGVCFLLSRSGMIWVGPPVRHDLDRSSDNSGCSLSFCLGQA